MRIVIDLQGAQSNSSRNRGIGRYSLSLAQGIARNCGDHELLIVLNAAFSESIEPIRAAFHDVLPENAIRVWNPPQPVAFLGGDAWLRDSSELLREAFLAQLQPDIVHVSSLFEGLNDNAVTSIGRFSQKPPASISLYDLIPLIYRKTYLENQVVATWYERKLADCRRSSLWLAISEASRQEGIEYLGLPADQVFAISTAVDPWFKKKKIEAVTETGLRRRYNLQRPFVMYTGGDDSRKNIEGLVRSFADLPPNIRDKYQLAVVCSVQPDSRQRLERLARQHGLAEDDLVLTGFVPEDDLVTLYNLCHAFVFPSVHEGFGMPVLEAMASGAPVIGANTSSVPEVIGRTDALFDPRCDRSITSKLLQILTDDGFRLSLLEHGPQQAKKFSWDIVARRAVAAFETADCIQRPVPTCRSHCRPRMAYISPLPPERSGIADYSAELLPELSRHYEIDVIVVQEEVSDIWVRANCAIRSLAWFAEHSEQYERILYHFGNSVYHQHMFGMLRRYPGVVVLHDFFLSGILAYLMLRGVDPQIWGQEIYHSHGYAAFQAYCRGEDVSALIREYPCNLDVLQHATGVVVHSSYSAELADRWYGQGYAADWQVIPHLRVPVHRQSSTEARNALGLAQDLFIVCSFGLVAPSKLNHRLLEAWQATPLAHDPCCRLIFVGEAPGDYGVQLQAACKTTTIPGQAVITGWLDHDHYKQYLAAADMAVQLRTDSRGETSGTVLDCMNYGLATIINAHGALTEMPEDAVCKLSDTCSVAELVDALTQLYQDADYRQQLGQRARERVLVHHAPRVCGDQYAQAIEKMYDRARYGATALVQSTAWLPTGADDNLLQIFAKHVAVNIPLKRCNRQILLDITVLREQSVSPSQQALLLAMVLGVPVSPCRIEPIQAVTSGQAYQYARQLTLQVLGWPSDLLVDDYIEAQAGDLLLCLAIRPEECAAQFSYYASLQRWGVHCYFVIPDLLQLLGVAEEDDRMFAELHERWMVFLLSYPDLCPARRPVADTLVDLLPQEALIALRSYLRQSVALCTSRS